jgi:anti-sigma B factor antagonist
MAPQNSIEVENHSGEAAIVTLRGEHDLSSEPALAQALDAACVRLGVVVDLSACSFMDSSVIGALLRCARSLHRREGLLELVVPSGARALRRVLEVMSVHSMLPVHETRAAAIARIERALQERQAARTSSVRDNGLSLRATSEVVEELSARGDR